MRKVQVSWDAIFSRVRALMSERCSFFGFGGRGCCLDDAEGSSEDVFRGPGARGRDEAGNLGPGLDLDLLEEGRVRDSVIDAGVGRAHVEFNSAFCVRAKTGWAVTKAVDGEDDMFLFSEGGGCRRGVSVAGSQSGRAD